MSSALLEWEKENTTRWRRLSGEAWRSIRRPVGVLFFCSVGFFAGARYAADAGAPVLDPELRSRLAEVERERSAAESELELVRLELNRANTVLDHSARYGIPADLAASIYDIALAEDIPPNLAFRLVRVESEFTPLAVSHKGAIGLTQVMPRTAFGLDPSLRYGDLFVEETNLHLGFRYLRLMLQRYDGDLRLALLAYNRGPGTVDNIRRAGGDPANGYARAVLSGQ